MYAKATSLFTALLLLMTGCADQGQQDGMMEGDTMATADTMQMQSDTMAAEQGAMEQVTLGVSEQEPYGQYLVDNEDRALYLFKKDQKGQASTCYDACAEAWPPLLSQGDPQADAPNVDSNQLGTIERKDGSMQVTYNGWPLYYFAKDQGSGDVMGQDKMGFGAEWYLVSPDGMAVEAEGETTEGS